MSKIPNSGSKRVIYQDYLVPWTGVALLPTSSPWSESTTLPQPLRHCISSPTSSDFCFTSIGSTSWRENQMQRQFISDQSRRSIVQCMTNVIHNWIKRRAHLMWRKLNRSNKKIDDTNDKNRVRKHSYPTCRWTQGVWQWRKPATYWNRVVEEHLLLFYTWMAQSLGCLKHHPYPPPLLFPSLMCQMMQWCFR